MTNTNNNSTNSNSNSDFNFLGHITDTTSRGNKRNGNSLNSLGNVIWTMAKAVPMTVNTVVRATAQVADYTDELCQHSDTYKLVQDTHVLSTLGNNSYLEVKEALGKDFNSTKDKFVTTKVMEDVEL